MSVSRKEFLGRCLAASLMAAFPVKAFSSGPEDEEFRKLLEQAGNAADDRERVSILEQALQLEIPEEEKEILRRILFIADNWAWGFEKYARPGTEGNESEGYLCGFLIRCRLDRSVLPQLPEDHRLFPLIAFYRSRMLTANLIQSGNIINVPDVRDRYLAESGRLMQIAAKKYPRNELAKNYLGTYSPWEEIVPPDPEAPDWANYQRHQLEKLTYLIHWWIDNRQIADGQFGGGWGDDVEIWRNWVPVLFAFDDEKAKLSKEKLFSGLFKLSRMQKGYTTIMNDVEHTAEEYADPLLCMLNMQPENPVWEERTLKAMDFIENIWTGINERGQLQFKSTWFNVDRVHPDDSRACDTPYHSRLMQPLMLLWLRTGNRRVERFVVPWLRTWVEATFTAEHGKPAGIMPAAIHWPDGRPAGLGEKWWQPENHTEPTLYYFPTQQPMMYECFLQAYHMTRDEFFLKPIRFIAGQLLKGAGAGDTAGYEPGSLDWSIATLRGSIPRLLIKYRLVTGDTSFDSIFSSQAREYERFIMERNLEQLTDEIREKRKALTLPVEFYTTEVRWTDRLFSSNRYFSLILDERFPAFDATFLFSCLTGSLGNYQIQPVVGVKWMTHSSEIAILTEENSIHSFRAMLYHFGSEPRQMGARLLNLAEGKYNWYLSGKKQGTAELTMSNREIRFTIPARKLCVLLIEPETSP